MFESSLKAELAAFVEERDWAQFHPPENLTKSIVIEAGELLECFQWSDEADAARVQEELADVLTYCMLLADRLGIEPDMIVLEKLLKTRENTRFRKLAGGARRMTPSDIYWVGFNEVEITDWAVLGHRNSNWPVVHILDNADRSMSGARGKALKDVYVGESRNAEARIRQHLATADKKHLRNVRVVVDATFNKPVCGRQGSTALHDGHGEAVGCV